MNLSFPRYASLPISKGKTAKPFSSAFKTAKAVLLQVTNYLTVASKALHENDNNEN
jgi:hypothetical protein